MPGQINVDVSCSMQRPWKNLSKGVFLLNVESLLLRFVLILSLDLKI